MIFSGNRRVNPVAARNCFLTNQFATPGLGSLMAGRIMPGLWQGIVAVAGFALVTVWFVPTMIQTYRQFTEGAPAKSYAGLDEAGALGFIAAWLWALETLLNLLRPAKTLEQAGQKNVPPRIDDVSGGTSQE
jgi:hypothetical protein